MNKIFFLIGFLLTTIVQSQVIKKVEPSFWWAGMEYNQVQVLVYGTGIAEYTPEIHKSLVKLVNSERSENKNYFKFGLFTSFPRNF